MICKLTTPYRTWQGRLIPAGSIFKINPRHVQNLATGYLINLDSCESVSTAQSSTATIYVFSPDLEPIDFQEDFDAL